MKNIIITGGELNNKGAQAMTFIAVDELKKRFPDHEILVLSPMDLKRPEEEREQYSFGIIGWYPLKFARAQKNPFLRLFVRFRNPEEYRDAYKIYINCELIVDVSGYAVGSGWPASYLRQFADHLEYACRFGIPMFLMPQSFGPFSFSQTEQKKEWRRIQKFLPGMRVICAREEEGYRLLKEQCHLKNVVLKPDLVLNNRGWNYKNVFKSEPKCNVPVIMSDSVCIVPNSKLLDIMAEGKLLSLYQSMINQLMNHNLAIYIVRHSDRDQVLCSKIKQLFPEIEQVICLDQGFSCIEFSELVKHFRFLIASRYHAIVHAYKSGVPCLVLGWADKYGHLAIDFSQESYYIDLRKPEGSSAADKMIETLNNRYRKESAVICSHLQLLQQESVFDLISL